MEIEEPLLPWDEPGWLGEITAWVEARLNELGEPPTGEIEVLHKRPWSAFAKVPTAGGVVYFKSTAPTLRHEAGLTPLLAGWQPDRIPPILATDRRKGWILSKDCGVTLRERDNTVGQLALWERLLPQYAQLQSELAPHTDAMLSVGVPDHRLEALPGLFAGILAKTDKLRLGLEGGLTHAEHARLLSLAPTVAEMCAELSSYGIPETIMHEEIHDANVLVSGDRFIFTDWSDCSISHPFLSLLVILRATAYRLKLEESLPEITRLRDITLDAWAQYGSRDHLRRAADLGYRLGMVSRSLSYLRLLGPLPEQYRIENDSIHGWLLDFLAAQTALDG